MAAAVQVGDVSRGSSRAHVSTKYVSSICVKHLWLQIAVQTSKSVAECADSRDSDEPKLAAGCSDR